MTAKGLVLQEDATDTMILTMKLRPTRLSYSVRRNMAVARMCLREISLSLSLQALLWSRTSATVVHLSRWTTRVLAKSGSTTNASSTKSAEKPRKKLKRLNEPVEALAEEATTGVAEEAEMEVGTAEGSETEASGTITGMTTEDDES